MGIFFLDWISGNEIFESRLCILYMLFATANLLCRESSTIYIHNRNVLFFSYFLISFIFLVFSHFALVCQQWLPFTFCYSDDKKLIAIFIWISLITSKVEHLFVNLLATFVFFANYLFMSFTHLLRFFLSSWFMGALSILWRLICYPIGYLIGISFLSILFLALSHKIFIFIVAIFDSHFSLQLMGFASYFGRPFPYKYYKNGK